MNLIAENVKIAADKGCPIVLGTDETKALAEYIRSLESSVENWQDAWKGRRAI